MCWRRSTRRWRCLARCASPAIEPWQLESAPEDLAATVAQAAVRLADQAGDGKLAVIVPQGLAGEIGASVTAALPGTAIGADPDLTSPVVVLTVKQAKGLEFDCVLIADPARMLAESPRGLNDLYVALTRATQQVGVVHPGQLPDVLGRLSSALSPAETRLTSKPAVTRRRRRGARRPRTG